MKASSHALNTSKALESARKLLEFACDKNWSGGSLDPDLIRIEFNNRMTRAIGRAEYKHPCDYCIKLSAPLWPRASEAERRNTVIHEACHLIDHYRTGTMSHGVSWRRLMQNCGESPDRCHSVDRTGLIRKRKRHEYTCGCNNRGGFITPIKAKRIEQGRSYFCKSCGENIRLTGKVVTI